MSVTLDAPQQHPTWRVACDLLGCHSRLYLQAPTAADAVKRVVDEYGWATSGLAVLLCPCFHEEVK